jgi:hypothetical protein
MSVNTPASWSAHALRTQLRDAVWADILAWVDTFKCLTHVGHGEGEGGQQSLIVCHIGGTVLSSKLGKEVFSLSGSKTSVSVT